MEDKEAEKASQMRRIFVGGLGESVTAEDLQRLFGSLGAVQGLDIVRSKSRSFAYVDFSPSSLKSLSKLFSTVRKKKKKRTVSILFIPLYYYLTSISFWYSRGLNLSSFVWRHGTLLVELTWTHNSVWNRNLFMLLSWIHCKYKTNFLTCT